MRPPVACAIVPEDELIQVNLELSSAHAMVGADQPLRRLQVHDRRVARPILHLGGVRILGVSAGAVFKTGLREPLKALETIRVDGSSRERRSG